MRSHICKIVLVIISPLPPTWYASVFLPSSNGHTLKVTHVTMSILSLSRKVADACA